MTKLDELDREKDELEQDMAAIRSQVDLAKARYMAEGIRADYDWLNKAQYALRMKGARHQQVLREAARLRKAELKAQRPVSQFFVDVAKEELESQDFEEILQMAWERKNIHDDALLSSTS